MHVPLPRLLGGALLCGLVSSACSSPGSTAPAAPAAAASAGAEARTSADIAALPALTPELRALLAKIKAEDSGQLAISEEDGRFLRVLVVMRGARRGLEIGGASGYSAIWIGLGMRETGGQLTTVEYDPERARALDANIKAAGLTDVVKVVAGDAFKAVPAETGTFDFVFIDAWKPDYQKYFEMTFPRLTRGGVLVAHNVINKGSEMKDFLQTISTRADLLTAIVAPGSEGVSVSVKR